MTPNATASAGSAPGLQIPVIGEYISVRAEFCGGKPHVSGHRIKVQHIAIWRERMGMTPEEIVATYPTLSLPAVFAALAYYHSHRDEIDADIVADEHLVAQMKANASPSKPQKPVFALHATVDPLPPG
jgi:uncharacterized protein (DUF433 family)